MSTHPNSHHGDIDGFGEGDGDVVVFGLVERGQPHVGVVARAVNAVDQVTHHSRVFIVLGEDIYIRRICSDLQNKYQHF